MQLRPLSLRRFAVALPLAAAMMLCSATAAFAQGKPAAGKPAPEISAKDLDGKDLTLSGFKGRVVLLDFWGDW